MHNVNVDTDSYFIRHLVRVGNSSTENIVVVGLITSISLTIDYEVHELEEATSSSMIDLEACVALRMIIMEDKCYCLVLRNQLLHPLPDPTRNTIQDRCNWLMTIDISPLEPIDMGLPT